jgi:hypothetical protein
MTVDSLFYSLRNRVPWSVARIMFMLSGLNPSLGWDSTIKKLTDTNITLSQETYLTLYNFYLSHVLLGNKAVKIFPISSVDCRKLKELHDTINLSEIRNPFINKFPFLLDSKNLKEIEEDIFLVNIEETTSHINFVFCTKSSFHTRENIERELSEEKNNSNIKNILNKYTKIYGIKKEEKQLFSVVAVHKNRNILEIRVDLPEKAIEFYIIQAFSQIIAKFNEICRSINFTLVEEECLNLFSLIREIYSCNSIRICEIGFQTNEGSLRGSIKHEKMKARKIDDLRNETYHHAGVRAINHINIFSIASIWDITISENQRLISNPEVWLPGSSRMLSEPITFLSEFRIKNNLGHHDYEFVLNDLLDRLNL